MFITLEGIEGAGKTSQVANIVALLHDRGYQTVTTREPGGTAIGQSIRHILLDPNNSELDPVAELLLYTADRIQHLRRVIEPNLASGKVVLCDRFFDATLVYQGYARGLDLHMIRQLHDLACNNIEPDLTLLLDLSPEEGLARAWRRINDSRAGKDDSRFEQEDLNFHQKVRDGYLALARQNPHRFRIINATQDETGVARDISAVLDAFLIAAVS